MTSFGCLRLRLDRGADAADPPLAPAPINNPANRQARTIIMVLNQVIRETGLGGLPKIRLQHKAGASAEVCKNGV